MIKVYTFMDERNFVVQFGPVNTPHITRGGWLNLCNTNHPITGGHRIVCDPNAVDIDMSWAV